MKRSATLLVGLTALLLGQVWLVSNKRGVTLDDLHGPPNDSLLPSFRVTQLGVRDQQDLRAVLTRDGRCGFVVFMEVTCPVCSRMRYSWPREHGALADSVGQPINVVWLFADKADAVQKFIEGFRHQDITVALVDDAASVIRRLGIVGTPVTYLVDAAGRKRVGLAGDRLPPSDVAARVCKKDIS
jgi:hypothetical protein